MDEDLEDLGREALLAEAKKMRAAIRRHRDSDLHELCWHHPDLWDLLPDKQPRSITVPEWPQFMRGCIRYRDSLDRQAPGAPRLAKEYGE